jgi:hypothetical protein
MAEAKLGHRQAAQAALDDYRSRRALEFAGAQAKPPEDTLLAEAEAVLRAAFPPGGGPEPQRSGIEAGRGSERPRAR